MCYPCTPIAGDGRISLDHVDPDSTHAAVEVGVFPTPAEVSIAIAVGLLEKQVYTARSTQGQAPVIFFDGCTKLHCTY